MPIEVKLSIDDDAEDIIKKARNGLGYIAASELDAHAFSTLAKQKLINYNLIAINADNKGLYHLTERGWNFTCFKDEDEIAELNRKKLRVDVQNSERVYKSYWSTRLIAWI